MLLYVLKDNLRSLLSSHFKKLMVSLLNLTIFSFKPKIRVFHGDHKIRDFFYLNILKFVFCVRSLIRDFFMIGSL